MFDVKGFMEKALSQQRNLLKIYEQRLKTLPKGSLTMSYSRGKAYYQKYYQGKRTYLGSRDQKDVYDLQVRKILEGIQQFDVLREEVVQEGHLRTLFTQLPLRERIILQIRLLCTKGHSSEWPFVYDCALFID